MADVPAEFGDITATGTRDDDPRKREKERRTRIKRLYGTDENAKHYWVDVEVLDNAGLAGAQYPGLDEGNQPLDTILTLDNRRDRRLSREKEEVEIAMDPDDEDGPKVVVKAISAITLQSRGGETVKRTFFNNRSNKSRLTLKQRIQCNNIDDEYLHDGADENDRQPPSDPKKYRKAVYDTDDEQSLFLDVQIPTGFQIQRGKDFRYQATNYRRLWGDAPTVRLPGMKASPKEAEPVVLDPYQAIVNFGPDSLAVEFE